MAFSKLYDTHAAAVADIEDGATVLIGGVSKSAEPTGLLSALSRREVSKLTLVCDLRGWDGSDTLLRLAHEGRISRLISPYPFVGASGGVIPELWTLGEIEVETVPQGTLAERLRAAGAGIGGVYIPVGSGTRFANNKETRTIGGVECILEPPLRADFAFLRAAAADEVGNLAYRGARRAWNAVMATAARITIVESDEIGEPGSIDPELVITPGIFVNRIVRTVGVPIL